MKKFFSRKVNIFYSSVILFVLHIPFVFAKPSKVGEHYSGKPILGGIRIIDSNFINLASNRGSGFSLYDSLRLATLGLDRQVFDYAMKGFNRMKKMGTLVNDQIISIVDFSKPSSKKRLYIIDLKNYKILFNTYVAHGRQSGKEFASKFSNIPESFQSSLGFYETGHTYMGGNGYSLRLQGIEKGINDNADRRDIVMHGAGYVDERLIQSQGYIGRSWGCPAVPQRLHKSIINKIKNGTCLFIYSPDKTYLAHSAILNSYDTSLYASNQEG